MNTVNFENYNSRTDLGLILSSKTIGSPAAKISTVDVPGGDSVLDFTDFFGEAKYGNRTLTFQFTCYDPGATKDSTIKNLLHGRRMKISLSEDNGNFYFVGRINVGDWAINKKIATLTVTCDCEPWRYKTAVTVRSFTVSTSQSVTLSNLRRTVVPKVTTNANVTLTWNGHTINLSAGTDMIIPDLILREGDTSLTIIGNATVSFKYQEGGF